MKPLSHIEVIHILSQFEVKGNQGQFTVENNKEW